MDEHETNEEHNSIFMFLRIDTKQTHPDEVTRILQLTPTEVHVLGEPIKHGDGTIISNHNRWLLGMEQGDDIEVLLDELIRIIKPHTGRFRDLPPDIYVSLDCFAYAVEYMPAVVFRNDQVKFLADINANIDVDMYCFRDHGKPNEEGWVVIG